MGEDDTKTTATEEEAGEEAEADTEAGVITLTDATTTEVVGTIAATTIVMEEEDMITTAEGVTEVGAEVVEGEIVSLPIDLVQRRRVWIRSMR